MKYILPLLFIVFAGCASYTAPPVPETPRERLAASLITFNGVLATYDQLQTGGIIEKGSAVDTAVKAALTTAHSAFAAWRVTPDSLDAERAALVALTAAQGALANAGKGAPA